MWSERVSNGSGIGLAVAVARQARGWTQAQLAADADLSQGFISKIEAGTVELVHPYLGQLADALGCPVELLCEPDLALPPGVSCIRHRRRRSRLTTVATHRVEGLASLTALTITKWVSSLDPGRRPGISAIESNGPEKSAAAIREALRLGDGPLTNVARVAESLGIPVVRRPLNSPGVETLALPQDGVSVQGGGRHPVIVLNSPLTGDRDRFTIAHELGHLVLHGLDAAVDDDEIEDEANRFAGTLLVPPTSGADILGGIDERQFRRLLELKHEWGVSVAALVQQALRLGSIDSATHKRMRMRITQMGWQRMEPGEVPLDEAMLLSEMIGDLRRMGLKDDEISAAGLMHRQTFQRVYVEGQNPRKPEE